MNDRVSQEFVNERISRATSAIKRVEKNRLDQMNGRMVLRDLKNLDSSKLDSKAPSPGAQEPPAPLLPAKEAAHLILLLPCLLFLWVIV